MHEMTLLNDLLKKVHRVADEHHANRIVGVTVRLGPLAHISASHLKEHFDWATRGTDLEGVELIVNETTDKHADDAQSILLDSIEIQ